MYVVLLMVAGYLLGSVPVAYLVGRARGVDMFQVGTGNPGAANVFRMVGRWEGVAVFLGDVGKGAVPVAVARVYVESPWVAVAAGVMAMVGHWYPVFLRFRGGAGLAPAIGAAYVMMPLAALVGSVPALAVLYFKRDAGFMGGVGFIGLFGVALLLGRPLPLTLAVAGLPALVLLRELWLPGTGRRRRRGR